MLRELAEDVDRELRNLPETSSSLNSQQHGAGVLQPPQESGRIEFTLEPVVERQSKRMGVHERVFETRVQQIGPILQGQNLTHALIHGLRRALERLLDNPDIDDHDRIFFRLSSNRLDNNFHSARFQAGEWRNDIRRVDEFMNVMSRMLNSNEQFELNDTFQLEFVHVRASPQGGGHGRDYKPGHQASTKFRLKKKCIVKIPRNEQNLCCARAIVTAKAHVDNHPKWRSFQRGLTIQSDEAIALHTEAHVEPGLCGMDELTRFSLAPSLFLKYRIIVVDVDRAYACFAFGEGEKQLAILHENGHYDALTSLPGFFSSGYFCGRCLHPYDHLGQHACPNATGIHCPACCQETCSDYHEAYKTKRLASHVCNSCRRVFYGPSCLELHSSKAQDGKPSGPQKPSVCQARRKCAHCRKLLVGRKEQHDHCCGWGECPSCREKVDLNTHRCFIQKAKDPDEIRQEKRAVQLAKRKKRRRQQGGDASKGLQTLRSNTETENQEQPDEYKEPLLVFFDIEAMQNTGKHIANLVVGMTAENSDPKIFRGPQCVDHFLEWLEVLTEEETREITVLAHNFKGYDSYFIVDALHRRKQALKQVRNGGKVLELTYLGGYIRFIDSMSFVPGPLSSFTKTFGLDPDQFKKGYFPHLFNTCSNMENDYRGELPPKKDYMPEGMSKEGKEKFEKWYEEQKSKGVQFHLRQELEDYCIDDVRLLREGCLTFQRDFRKRTRFCPFEQITIASACNRDLRLNRMQENTIASEPLYGWRLDVNHSKAAMEWLTFEEQQLRRDAWLACSVDERNQLEEIFLETGDDSSDPRFRQRIQHARNQGEYRIPDTRWTVDGYDVETNTIYEFLGCFWHGCPKCFPQRSETYRRLNDRSMADVHQETVLRLQSLSDRGYSVKTIWECEWQKCKNHDPEIAEIVAGYDLEEPLSPRDAFFGGRTNAVRLHYEVKEHTAEQIKYYDYTSLYPWTNKTQKYPVGHPEMIYAPPREKPISDYFGLAKCRVVPPYRLFHPVLPYRTHNKLTFPLCRTCVEENIDRPLHGKVSWCGHNEQERALTGTWCTPELEKAEQMGYVIQTIHEVWHFRETQVGLFEDYVNTWLKLKTEASGWPAWCDTEEKKQLYITQFQEKEGISLEYEKIAVNPGQRALAKLMLNSMWGKFGQQVNKLQVKEFIEPQAFCSFMDSDQHNVRFVSCIDEQRVEVHHREEALCENISPNLNIFVACFTTCWARLRLYEALELLNERVLYFDTDSVIFVQSPGEIKPVLGDYLGDFTDELTNGDFITEFCSGGPKNYGYRTKKDKYCCKVRGFSLTVEGMTQLNYQVLRENTLKEIQKPLDSPRKTRVAQTHKIVRVSKDYQLWTKEAHKEYKLVFNKRVLDPQTAITYPYGYRGLDSEDEDLIATMVELMDEDDE